MEDSRLLARQFAFDLVVSTGSAGEPPRELERLGDRTRLVQVGTKSMFVSVVGLFADGSFKYQRVPLDSRFPDSPDMLRQLATYQKELERSGLEGLGLKSIPHPTGLKFVGSEACADCHGSAFQTWKKSKHAHAIESLVHPRERSEIQRHFDPECLSCHVTGWNAPKHFPYLSGYRDYKRDALLHGVGCENCHGPGSAHVAAENGEVDDETEIARLRKQMAVTLEFSRTTGCVQCHDLDNSPDFDFDAYWERIKH